MRPLSKREQQVLAACLDRLEHVAVDRRREPVGRLVAGPGGRQRRARRAAPGAVPRPRGCGLRAGSYRLARSVSRRGPATNPAAVNRRARPACPPPRLAVDALELQRARPGPRATRLASASATAAPVGGLERLQREHRAAAALDERQRLAVAQHHVAPAAREARPGGPRGPAQRDAVRVRRIARGQRERRRARQRDRGPRAGARSRRAARTGRRRGPRRGSRGARLRASRARRARGAGPPGRPGRPPRPRRRARARRGARAAARRARGGGPPRRSRPRAAGAVGAQRPSAAPRGAQPAAREPARARRAA